MTSQPIPSEKENLGPVFDVVADNLIETVMDPTHDVVVHFYAECTPPLPPILTLAIPVPQ